MASVLRTRLRIFRAGPLALTLLVFAGLPVTGHALGLGEIALQSNLNERLVAEIPLTDLRGLEAEEIRVSLASNADFERLGVERFFFLGDLRFQVEISRAGTGRVRVTSERPITEPYLNFLVQVLWPQGRLLKEYTLLLDPPTFSQAAAPVVRPAEQAPPTRTAGAIERPATRVDVAPVTARAPAASPLDAGIVGDEYRMTDHTDTLWSIARRARPSAAVSVQQTMLAILRKNPDAFIDNNINRMKAGMTLRLPTEEEARALGQAEALEQVALHDRAWRGESVADAGAQPPPAAAPAAGPAAIDASPAPASQPAATETAEGRLRIVAGAGDSPVASVEPDTGETTVGGAPPPDLAAALEERDRLAREVSDLASQLDRERELAANQLAVKDRLLEVKDQQMAEVEAELARLREVGATAAPAQSQDQNARRDASAWWQSPLVMGAGAGVVVLLLAVGLVAARRRRTEQAFAVPGRAAEPQVGQRAAKAPFDARARAAAGEPSVAGAAGFATGQGARAMAAEATGTEFSDVIAEADVYLTYGRHGQAAGLLQSALENDPMRQDVRLKLLEVLAAAGDRAGFDTELAALRAQATDPGLLEAATALATSFGSADASRGSAQAEQNLIEYDVELFPERADSEADTAADATVVRAAPVAGTEEDIPDLEFDLGGPDQEGAGARLGHGQAGDPQAGMLGGDLGIDFRLDDEAFRVEADDLEALDDTALAREMDGLPLEDEAFEFADEGDSASTKLDLARAYNEMGDAEGAREILLEVLKEGSTEQQQAAQELLARL